MCPHAHCHHGPHGHYDHAEATGLPSTPEWVHGILLDHPNLLPVSSILKQGPSIDMIWYDWEDESAGVKSKRSMLQLAAEVQAAKCVQLLLEAGADPRLASPSDGKTPLHLACQAKPSMASARVIAMLVQHGADRDAVDFEGNKPGHALERMSLPLSHASSTAPSVTSAFDDAASDASDVSGVSSVTTATTATTTTSVTSVTSVTSFSIERQKSTRSQENHGLHSRLATSKGALVTEVADLELMDGVDYGCAHFRMFHYKVDMCPHEDCIHDTDACPYVHPGDKSRRRNPGLVNYQPVPCPHFRKGNCRLGDACPLSHGVFECWLHPVKYRTQLCTEGSKCAREVCFFAHSLDELREPFEDCEACSMATCRLQPLNAPVKSVQTSGCVTGNAANVGNVCTPRSICHGRQAGFNSATTSPETSEGSISFCSPAHEIPCVGMNVDRKIATLQATATDRERIRHESAMAGIIENLKSMAVSRNATLQTKNPPGSTGTTFAGITGGASSASLYKRTSVQDAASVLSIPNSDSSVSLTLGSSPSRGLDLFTTFAYRH